MLDTTTGIARCLRVERAIIIERSRAQRPIPVRKRNSITGLVIDPFRCREIKYESVLERAWARVLIAHPLVDEVLEQQRYSIRRTSGVTHYWIDFLVVWKSGVREAFSVKYDEDTDDDEAVLEEARKQGNGFADKFNHLTELMLSPIAVANAELIIDCAKDHDYEAETAVAEALQSSGPCVQIGDCDAFVGDGRRGSRAAIALIQSGALVAPDGERIGRSTVLGNLFTK